MKTAIPNKPSSAEPSQRTTHPRWTARQRETFAFYVLISPWLIGFILFTAGPMLVSLGVSMTNWKLLSAPEWVGVDNYVHMFTRDRLFWQSLQVTVTYTALYVPTELIGGLGLAVLMNRRLRGISLLRAIFYLPSVLSGVAFVVVWIWILHPNGLLNGVLAGFGIQGPHWLTNPGTALISLWMMSLWGLGRAAVIYLAALKNVSAELLEAAAIDGASRWLAFWRVTIPLITPTIFFNLVLSIISTFQTFTSAYVATDGGPLNSTLFYVLYLYKLAFRDFKMGRASAMAWVLFLGVFVLTLLIVRSSRQWVHYEGDRR